jgi:site-specific recombinase XerD
LIIVHLAVFVVVVGIFCLWYVFFFVCAFLPFASMLFSADKGLHRKKMARSMDESAAWFDFETSAYAACTTQRVTHVRSALKLLRAAAVDICGGPAIRVFLQRTWLVGTNDLFSQSIAKLRRSTFLWKDRTTAVRYFQIIRHILANNKDVSPVFVSTIRLQSERNFDIRPDVVPRKYYGHAQRAMLDLWVETFQLETTNRSKLALKNIMFFVLRCCKSFGLDLNNWPIGEKLQSSVDLVPTEAIVDVCQGSNCMQKISWLTCFFKHCLCVTKDLSAAQDSLLKKRKIANRTCVQDDTDRNTIDVRDVDLLYAQTLQRTTRDQICFLLLLSTGMRVGAMVKIQLSHICHIDIYLNKFVVHETAKTIEKGNKWHSFPVIAPLRELLVDYLANHRPACNSIYLFPGRNANQHMSTMSVSKMFRTWCQMAHLSGKQFHVHSLRHVYAHMVRRVGNSDETVSKLLGHQHVSTTTKYYTRENALEVLGRANVPWVAKQSIEKTNPLPLFLEAFCNPDKQLQDDMIQSKKQKISDLNMLF